jgi:hypothetical protein
MNKAQPHHVKRLKRTRLVKTGRKRLRAPRTTPAEQATPGAIDPQDMVTAWALAPDVADQKVEAAARLRRLDRLVKKWSQKRRAAQRAVTKYREEARTIRRQLEK